MALSGEVVRRAPVNPQMRFSFSSAPLRIGITAILEFVDHRVRCGSSGLDGALPGLGGKGPRSKIAGQARAGGRPGGERDGHLPRSVTKRHLEPGVTDLG